MLHGEVHGAFQTLVARVDYLPGEAIQSLLDIQIVVGIVQIVVSKPVVTEAPGDGFHVLAGEPVLPWIYERLQKRRHSSAF